MGKITGWFNGHRKAITAAAGVVIGGATVAFGTSNHWVTLAVAAATALGVYAVPNTDSKRAAARRVSPAEVSGHPDH